MKIRGRALGSVAAARVHAIAAMVAMAAMGCGPSTPAASPEPKASTPAEPPASTAPSASSAAPAAPAPAPGPAPVVVAEPTTSVTAVSNEITTPAVVSHEKVIAGLRPKFNTCYQEALKKDAKAAGSVTLSAKIEKDGTVSAVTPKAASGLSPAAVKCLSDQLKAASFAASGGMNYATSLDIPLSFTANQ